MPISLKLGDFTFDGAFECPQLIPGGGKQAIVKHDRIGGIRTTDSMGSFDNNVNWSGTFIGITAEDRVKYLNGLRQAGNQLVLSYSTFQFLVVIESFTWNFKPNFFIDYEISCTVIADQTQPVNFQVPSAFNDTVLVDLAEALSLAELIANPGVTSTLALLNAAITNVPGLGGASNATLAGIIAAAQAALIAINQILGAVSGSSSNSQLRVGLGSGILTNTYVNTQNIAQNIDVLEKLWSDYANAYQMRSAIARIQRNVEIAMSPSGTSEQIINAHLFQVAVEKYGDAMQWTAIAQANLQTIQNADGFPDPFVSGIESIVIPPKPANSSDGIMDYA
jgi:hypothetical protein